MAARRNPTQNPNAVPVKHRCDDCALATWVTDNQRHLSLEGKPICKRCPEYEYYIVRGKEACSKWKAKQGNK